MTHSLTTVLTLAVVALAIPPWRTPTTGPTIRVFLHLARDVATGPGTPALWPIDSRSVVLSYAVYVVLVVVATGSALIRHTLWVTAAGNECVAP